MNPNKLLLLPILKYKELDDLFKCGVCQIPLFCLPAYSCDSVKSICKTCYDGYYHPRSIQVPPEYDNALEQRVYYELASLTPFPCCFPPCEAYVGGDCQTIDHIYSHCKFRKIRCPLAVSNRTYLVIPDDVCNWQGSTDEEMVRHILETHSKYILHNTPPSINLRFLIGPIPRRLYFIIHKSDLISLILIERSNDGFTIAFRQNRPEEAIDVCYYEMIPSGKEGKRLWSFLFNGTMYGYLTKLSKRQELSDEARIIELHIQKVGQKPYPDGFKDPHPKWKGKVVEEGFEVIEKIDLLSLGKNTGEPNCGEATAISKELQTTPESENKEQNEMEGSAFEIVNEIVNEVFEIVDEVPEQKLTDLSKNNSDTEEFIVL